VEIHVNAPNAVARHKKYASPKQADFQVIVFTFIPVHHLAPSDSKAPLSSLIAVGISSKFSADIAHRACFWAFMTASSSTTTFARVVAAGGAAEYAG
jgi:hypothetical protein